MIIPTEEEMKMYAKFAPLEKWRKRGYGAELRDDAPEDMKALALEEQKWYEELRKKKKTTQYLVCLTRFKIYQFSKDTTKKVVSFFVATKLTWASQ